MTLFFIFHSVVAVAVAFIFSALFGKLTAWIAVFSLLVGLALGYFLVSQVSRDGNSDGLSLGSSLRFLSFARGDSGWIEKALFVFVAYAAFRHFIALVFPFEKALWTLNVNNFGDLPLHINFIRQAASGHSFPLVNPSFAAETLRYPFGSDLYNSLWESVGVPLSGHLFFTGMFATMASLVALRAYAGWWGIGAFFLSGGFIGIEILLGRSQLFDVLQFVDWKNFFLTVFVTQRGMLFAIPIGLMLLRVTQRHFSGVAPLSGISQVAYGVVWGVLPFFHAHAFVVISLMMAGHAMIERVVGPRSKFGLMSVITRALGGAWELLTSRMAMFAYLPAIYFVWRISDGFGRAGVVHIDWMWLGEVKGAAEYLTRNFGAWLLVPAITALALWHRGTEECRRLRLEFVLHSGLFILFFNVMLAPWAWDNVKVLIWPYLGFSRIAWISTERLLSSLLGRFLRLFLALFLFFSGYYAVKYSLLNERRGVKIYSASDLALTEGALAQVPLNSVFAASPTHNHSLSWFGRLRVVGYEGHLHSHGIDYRSTLAKHERIMRGDPQWLALCRELGVTHIFWGQEERSRYGDGPRPWMDALPNVSRVPSTAIFYIAN